MSGGADSTSVAAAAVRAVRDRRALRAATIGFDSLISDTEHRFASLAASSLGIVLDYLPGDHYTLYGGWDDIRYRGCEPTDLPLNAIGVDLIRHAAHFTDVLLTGEGGDAVMRASTDHFANLLRRFRWWQFIREAGSYALRRHRLPPLLLRSRLYRLLGFRNPATLPYPVWLDRDFERRVDAHERWRRHTGPHPPLHAWRADAYRFLTVPYFVTNFEISDPGYTGDRLHMTSPYFDQRVVEFLFALPPMPWFADKELVRGAMEGWLPDEVRLRRKTPLGGDPVAVLFNRQRGEWSSFMANAEETRAWVDRQAFTAAWVHAGKRDVIWHTPPISLAMWLRGG
jgi:asparagine synthase (glutamine-hydrolysing)